MPDLIETQAEPTAGKAIPRTMDLRDTLAAQVSLVVTARLIAAGLAFDEAAFIASQAYTGLRATVLDQPRHDGHLVAFADGDKIDFAILFGADALARFTADLQADQAEFLTINLSATVRETVAHITATDGDDHAKHICN